MENQKTIKIGNFEIGNKLPLAIIAGPCQIESRQHAVDIAGAMVEMTKELGVNYIFKASYDKANRTSLRSPRGVGIEEGMKTFDEIKKLYGCPILTDVHEREQCAIAAEHVDMLQIPAFLCRQTDLVIAAAQTGKIINIKKGQFLAPWDMKNLVMKSVDSGNPNVCLTERGTCFGYNTLVTDMRAFPQMAKDTGCPISLSADKLSNTDTYSPVFEVLSKPAVTLSESDLISAEMLSLSADNPLSVSEYSPVFEVLSKPAVMLSESDLISAEMLLLSADKPSSTDTYSPVFEVLSKPAVTLSESDLISAEMLSLSADKPSSADTYSPVFEVLSKPAVTLSDPEVR